MSKFSLINYLQDMEYWDMKWGYKSPQLWVQAYKRKLMPEFIPSSFRSTFFSWTFSHPVVKSAARWHMANFPHMLWVSHACMGNFDITLTRHDWINYFLISALENILSILPTFVCVLFFFQIVGKQNNECWALLVVFRVCTRCPMSAITTFFRS